MMSIVTAVKHFVRSHIFLLVFLAFYFCFTLLTYKAYPISNGEEYRYLRGKETLEHFLYGQFTEKMIQPIPNYFLYNLYPLVLVALNPKFYYEWFHLFNLLFASLGFVSVYFLAFELSKSKKVAIASIAALVLFPRFFGELAINPVDMPFMVFYVTTLLMLLKFSSKSSEHWSTLLLGILLGITQGLRQIGLTLYVVMIILDLYDFYFAKGVKDLRFINYMGNRLLKYVYITITAFFFMLITWPNYAVNFFKSTHWYLFIGSNFYLWDFGLLFFGKFLENFERPWFYLPFFQIITYPIYITIFFIFSLGILKKKLQNRSYVVLVAALTVNYLLYFILHPVLYDGIRHFLFLIPLITILAIDALFSFLATVKPRPVKLLLVTFVVINLAAIGRYSIKEFPYIYPYFNQIAYVFGDPYKLFESDYASTKYRQASEWIRDVYLSEHVQYQTSDPKTMLKIYACDNAYAVDYFSHKKFLTIINRTEADLVLCDYKNLLQSGYTGQVIKSFFHNDQEVLFLLDMP